MALVKFKDAYPNYRETLGDTDAAYFDEYSVYSGDDKVGSVKDALFDEMSGKIRYLIVDTGFWIFGKNVLLPIGLARFDSAQKRIYANGLTKEQVESLPEYKDEMTVDYDYEESLRNTYRPLGETRARQLKGNKYQAYSGVSAQTYSYDMEPGLYEMDEIHQPIRLYQERLIADKDRFKTGEVAVSKRVETETQEVSIPVEKERIVIERSAPKSTVAAVGVPDFQEGEVARMETHSETADIRKEAFVREEVSVRKEVDTEVITEKKTLRREELDVETEGDPNVVKR